MMYVDEFPTLQRSTSDPFRWFLEQAHHGWAMQIQASTGWNYVTCKLMARQLADASWRGVSRPGRTTIRKKPMSDNCDCET